MSVLTKLFVVLVSVLSVLLVALVVPFVANTENFRTLKEEETKKLVSAETTARERQAEITALRAGEAETITNLRGQNQELTAQVNLLTGKLAEAEMRAASQQAAISKMEADLSRLTAAEEQHARFLAAQEEELKTRRESAVDLQTRLIQSADRINEVTNQNEQLNQALRRFREEKQALTEQVAELEAQLRRVPAEYRTATTAAGEPFEPSTLIQGEVTEVQTLNGQVFAQVNVGANDGVAQNMKFMIHDGDKYLGDLVISLVDDRASAGVVKMAQGTIGVGAKVRTGGRF